MSKNRRSFIREVVGLSRERGPEDNWAWFWTGTPGKSPRLGLHEGPLLFEEHSPLPEGKRFGPVHFALSVPRDRVEALVAKVRKQSIKIYGPVTLSWMNAQSWYFFDPDGHLAEFWSPDPEK